MDREVEQEQLKTLKTKIEVVKIKVQASVADSDRWKRKYYEMLDLRPGSVNSRRNSNWKSDKIAASPTKRSAVTKQSSTPKKASGGWLSPLR